MYHGCTCSVIHVHMYIHVQAELHTLYRIQGANEIALSSPKLSETKVSTTHLVGDGIVLVWSIEHDGPSSTFVSHCDLLVASTGPRLTRPAAAAGLFSRHQVLHCAAVLLHCLRLQPWGRGRGRGIYIYIYMGNLVMV